MILKHFTARDIISRWDVADVYWRATASTVCRFLDQLQARMPFPIKAIQVDGGTEFEAEFEEELKHGIRFFILSPVPPSLMAMLSGHTVLTLKSITK